MTCSVVGYPQSRSFDIEVVGPEAPRISNIVRPRPDFFEVFITDGRQVPLERKTVFWRLDDTEYEPTITGPDGKTIKVFNFVSGRRVYVGIEIGMSGRLYERAIDF